MPTIEIASINATNLGLKQSDFQVAIVEEDILRSHRGLFYDYLLKYQGSIVHIGNPDLKADQDGGFFAGMLIDWSVDGIKNIVVASELDDTGANQQYAFKFLNDFKADIDMLLNRALEKSPIKRVLFLTDYQFGPSKAQKEIIYTISDFWTLHDNNGLRFNTLYEMYGA